MSLDIPLTKEELFLGLPLSLRPAALSTVPADDWDALRASVVTSPLGNFLSKQGLREEVRCELSVSTKEAVGLLTHSDSIKMVEVIVGSLDQVEVIHPSPFLPGLGLDQVVRMMMMVVDAVTDDVIVPLGRLDITRVYHVALVVLFLGVNRRPHRDMNEWRELNPTKSYVLQLFALRSVYLTLRNLGRMKIGGSGGRVCSPVYPPPPSFPPQSVATNSFGNLCSALGSYHKLKYLQWSRISRWTSLDSLKSAENTSLAEVRTVRVAPYDYLSCCKVVWVKLMSCRTPRLVVGSAHVTLNIDREELPLARVPYVQALGHSNRMSGQRDSGRSLPSNRSERRNKGTFVKNDSNIKHAIVGNDCWTSDSHLHGGYEVPRVGIKIVTLDTIESVRAFPAAHSVHTAV
uniref:(California timema) hypothetical protein n=1 Tax=Timema californicum TaxID=61474 RepID=A0A7R9P3L5_TIMCA|nr:unnamed protein product [Timema californicum]